MPRLVFKKGEHPPVEITGATVLGRSAEQAQIAIKDTRLSRAHCKFELRDDGQWAILDLGSQNGTFLNGRRIRESVLRPGDTVTIGACDITFEAIGGPTGSDLMAGVASTRIGPSGSQKPVPPAGSDGPAELALEENAEESSNATRTVVAPAALSLLQGTLKDKIFPLIKDVFTVGRKAGNDIVLDGDGKSSGQHARITRKDPTTWVIEDLKSTNGVTVNGHKVEEPVVLKNGAKIVIGSQTFQFTLQGKPVETSGVTAPMSAKAVAAKLAEKAAEEPPADLGDEAIGNQSEQIDKAALNVEVRGGAKSGVLFSIIEILLALVIVGGVLAGGWMMLQDEQGGQSVDGGNPPALEGGLLKNTSFDKLDAAGSPDGWSFDPRGGDQLSITESAHGGEHAVQLTRFTAGNAVSYLVSSPIEVAGKGYRASVFALNSEISAGRTGCAMLALLWQKRADEPAFALSPLDAKASLKDWTELKGSAGAPAGAKFVRLAVGISGRSGSVVFDDAQVAVDDNAPPPRAAAAVDLKNGLRWAVEANGVITLFDKTTVLLREGRVAMHQVEGELDPLEIGLFLTGLPELTPGESSLSLRFKYFDPLAEKPVELRLELGESARQATAVVVFSGAGADKASAQAALSFVATSAFVPSELLRIEGGHVAEYRREIPAEAGRRVAISTLLCADTGTGNRIEAINGSAPQFSGRSGQGGRMLFFQQQGGLQVAFSLGQRRDDLRNLAALCAQTQPGEDPLDRLERAISIILEFPYNQQELLVAATACDSVATHYKLRHLELRDGVNVPELTRNEGLYIAAMDESIASAIKLRAKSADWSDKVKPALTKLEADSMSETTRRAATTAKAAIDELIQSANDFEQLAAVARKARFWLRVAIEQRESRNLLLSAQDFLDSGLLTQGRIKLKFIIENYPRCANGIAAKGLMVSQAEALFAEAEKRTKDGLGSIAGQLKAQCRAYLLLVEQNLLTSDKVLSAEERAWLLAAGVGEDAKNWPELESKLAERIRLLKEKVGK